MFFQRSLFFVMLVTLLPAAALAQRPPDPRGPDEAKADTTRFLPHWMMATAEAGVGWMNGPTRVSSRYTAGLDAGLSFAAQPAKRVRVGVAFEYHDLPGDPNGYAGYFDSTGVYPMVPFDLLGDGRMFDALATLHLRMHGAWWIEGGAGLGYFSSGFGEVLFVDGATGDVGVPPGTSGWGPVVGANLRYEFQPTPRDRLYASVGWRVMDRDGFHLNFVPIRIGYRFD